MEIQNKTKSEILVEISTMLRYLADLVEALVEEKIAPQNVEQVEEKTPITLLEVRELLAQKSQDGFSGKIHELLAKFGGKKLSEIDPKHYAELMKQAEELKNV